MAADAAADAADDFPSVSFTEISFNGLRCESCSTKLSILLSIPAIIFVSGIYGGVGSSAAGGAVDGADGGAAAGSGAGTTGGVCAGGTGVCAGGTGGVCAGGTGGVCADVGFSILASSSSNPCLKRS